MALPRPLPPPPGRSTLQWTTLLHTSPGEAAAQWMAAHVGAVLEEEGPNKGKLLREWMAFPEAVDGNPYCGRLAISIIDAAGGERVARPRKHWLWHNGEIAEWQRAHKHNGTWLGWNVEPLPGMIVFHSERGASDAGEGGHADLLLSFDRQDRMLHVVGANVSNTIRLRTFRLGHPSISGFGFVRRAAA